MKSFPFSRVGFGDRTQVARLSHQAHPSSELPLQPPLGFDASVDPREGGGDGTIV